MAGEVTDEGAVSVLDLGTGSVKALVVEAGPGRITVLAAAAVPAPPADSSGTRPLDGLVAVCERALVAAEDAARVVPVRAFFGLTAQRATVSAGDVETQLARAGAPLSAEELAPLIRRAQQAALATARRHDAAEFATPTMLHPLDTTITLLEVDGRPAAALAGPPAHPDEWRSRAPRSHPSNRWRGENAGGPRLLGGAAGRRLRLSLAAAFAPQPAVDEALQLAERLDLEIAGLLLSSFALGGALAQAGHGPALVVDVGAEVTQVILIDECWAEALATVPLGGSGLEGRVAEALGLSPVAAHEAIAAHAAGAGTKSAAGSGAAQAIRQLAEHHAAVWLDALGIVCAELGRTRTLPATLLLCGGGASLPEIARGLKETGWHAGLPFESAPTARRLTPQDLPAVVDRALRLPALQAVPALSLAAVAGGAYATPTPLSG